MAMTKLGYLVTATYQQDFYAFVTKYVRVFHTYEQALKYVDAKEAKGSDITYSITPIDIEEEEGG